MTPESKTVQIQGAAYVLTKAPARVALKAAARIANVIAPALSGVADGKGAGRLLGGVGYLLGAADLGDNLIEICDMFAPYSQVATADGRSFSLGGPHGVFDTHFAGRLDAMAEWLEASVEYNCGNFLEVALAKINASAPAAALKSDSPNPSEKSG